ncbi:AraC family transcriptional regulator [Leptotrichia sp. OH3620_COT-345]|uniref:AraC family transcriptional regulator n=1 Tax=Leptotrichia sp. OH3620_COT-345 TaxID=2491048 RepID=UPI000F64C993|nr:AraC family transcriptional regulator [Leptotrichia sp. OH3620_COT-345]RRD38838.1 AraC family transcriptional regulator [Leptotrichia sp. OH3620_COT-345]
MKKRKDEFYGKILGKIFEIRKEEKEFSEKYHIADKKSKELKGILERYYFEGKYEMSIINFKGKVKEVFETTKDLVNYFEIMYCLGGECTFYSEYDEYEKKYHVKKGDVVVHRIDDKVKKYRIDSQDFEYLSIDIYVDKVASNFTEMNKKSVKWKEDINDIFKINEFRFGKTSEETDLLSEEIKNISVKNMSDYLFLKSKVFQLITAIFILQYKNPEKTNKIIIDRTKAVLENYKIAELPSVKELCETLNISRYQLKMAFLKAEKIEITKYLRKKKMDYARLLLLNTDKSISEIATETGYENPSKFSKSFKNYFGVLPNKYRKIN